MPNEQPPHKGGEGYDLPDSDNILEMDSDTFQASFGESIDNIFDLNKWYEGEALADTYERLDDELKEVFKQENRIRKQIRSELFPRVFERKDAPQGAGCYQATIDQLAHVHSGLLFNGAVEACDGITVAHDSLSMTIAQIGVSLTTVIKGHGYRNSIAVTYACKALLLLMTLLSCLNRDDGVLKMSLKIEEIN